MSARTITVLPGRPPVSDQTEPVAVGHGSGSRPSPVAASAIRSVVRVSSTPSSG